MTRGKIYIIAGILRDFLDRHMYHFYYTLVPTYKVTLPDPTVSMSSYIASIMSRFPTSRGEKVPTSFADTESQRTGLSREQSSWNRIFS